MRNLLLGIIIIFVAVDMGLYGQARQPVLLDGNKWIEMGKIDNAAFLKLMYLKGLYDGLGGVAHYLTERSPRIFAKQEDLSKVLAVLGEDFNLGGSSSLAQIVDGIEEIYKDYANKMIPVFAIASLVNKRILGRISDQDFDGELVHLRSITWPTK